MWALRGMIALPRQKGREKAIKAEPSIMFIAIKWRNVVRVSSRCSQNQWTCKASGDGINDTASIKAPLKRIIRKRPIDK